MSQASLRLPAGQGLRRRTFAVLATGLAVALSSTGCGNTYRPVISAINPVGPAGQPIKYAIAISSPSVTTPGLLTAVDFSGDTIISTPSILTNPSYFATTENGVQGFVINAAGSLNTFGLSNPSSILTSNVVQTTLPAASGPVSLSAINIGSSGTTLFVPQTNTSTIAALTASGPALIEQVAVGAKPVYVVGADSAIRVYAISQSSTGTTSGCSGGQVASLEASTLSISTTICVGNTPVYGVMTSDDRRAFILNKGSGTVNVINVVNNALDNAVPVINTGGAVASTIASNPVWADLSPLTNELVVLNAGDGTHTGSLSIINIPLCSSSTPTTNPNCDASNPVDATGFGQVLATVPVGISPSMVSVLRDGSRAYVINQKDSTGQCNAGEGSVTVVDLVDMVVSSTICGISTPAAVSSINASPTLIYGHPNSIVTTSGNPTGKVYVTSPDAQFLTVIYTDTDTVATHIPIGGAGVRVLVTQP